jgi:hypothetical protein
MGASVIEDLGKSVARGSAWLEARLDPAGKFVGAEQELTDLEDPLPTATQRCVLLDFIGVDYAPAHCSAPMIMVTKQRLSMRRVDLVGVGMSAIGSV